MVDRYKAEVSNVQATAHMAAHSAGEYVRASDYDALAARCAELEANLLHYGAHMVSCDFIQDTLKCSCGFEDIRKQLSGTPGDERG